MAATRRGDISGGIAVLGLLIQQPDTAAGVGQRLTKRFPRARFARSAVHNALPALEAQGLVEIERAGSERAFDRYRATAHGEAIFRSWLREPAAASPVLRDGAHARLAFAEPEDLAAIIEAVAAEEHACAEHYATAHAELLSCMRSDGESPWRSGLTRLARADEATLWLTRLKRLQRLRAGLERLRDEAAAGAAHEHDGVAPQLVGLPRTEQSAFEASGGRGA